MFKCFQRTTEASHSCVGAVDGPVVQVVSGGIEIDVRLVRISLRRYCVSLRLSDALKLSAAGGVKRGDMEITEGSLPARVWGV